MATTVATRHAIAAALDGTATRARPMAPPGGLKARTTISDPAPRRVKCGAGHAQQSDEQHSIVEPIGCRAYAREAPELDVETLRDTRLDASTRHHGRSQIRSIARRPGPRQGHRARLNPITPFFCWRARRRPPP